MRRKCRSTPAGSFRNIYRIQGNGNSLVHSVLKIVEDFGKYILYHFKDVKQEGNSWQKIL